MSLTKREIRLGYIGILSEGVGEHRIHACIVILSRIYTRRVELSRIRAGGVYRAIALRLRLVIVCTESNYYVSLGRTVDLESSVGNGECLIYRVAHTGVKLVGYARYYVRLVDVSKGTCQNVTVGENAVLSLEVDVVLSHITRHVYHGTVRGNGRCHASVLGDVH